MPIRVCRPSWGPLVSAGLFLSLAACSGAEITVVRSSLVTASTGKTAFVMLPAEGQENTPGYERYAALITDRLTAHGLTQVATAADARYAVMVFYGVHGHHHDGGPGPGGGSGGGHHGHGMGGGGMGGGGMGGGGGHRGGGGDSDTTSAPATGTPPSTTTQQMVAIDIYDLTQSGGPQENVFDAHARGPADEKSSGDEIPALIDAALKDFPGQEHETYTVDMPPN